MKKFLLTGAAVMLLGCGTYSRHHNIELDGKKTALTIYYNEDEIISYRAKFSGESGVSEVSTGYHSREKTADGIPTVNFIDAACRNIPKIRR